MPRLAAVLAALASVAVVAAAASAAPPVDFLEPPPADRSTARLAVATGQGERRLAIWTAGNARQELCFGWRTGRSTAPPASFACLRRGLEQPVVAVAYGGGRGNQTTWGLIAGVASPRVARLVVDTTFGTPTTHELTPSAAPAFRGWRAFTSGLLEHPSSATVNAYARGGSLVAQVDGSWIYPTPSGATRSAQPPGVSPGLPVITAVPPPRNGRLPPASGPAWRDLETNLPRAGKVARQAIPIALANRAVQSVLRGHDAWLVGMTTWGNCSGRRLGGVVSFQFAAPATFVTTLPAVNQASRPSSSYSTLVRRVQANNWTTMHVWVDSGAAEVVGVHELVRWIAQSDELDGRTIRLATVVFPRDAGGPNPHAPECSRPEPSG